MSDTEGQAQRDQHGEIERAADVLVELSERGMEAAGWHNPETSRRTSIAAGPFIDALPQVGNALAAGRTVRLVGPETLLRGIDSGALHWMQTSSGQVGTAVDKSGRFASVARFEYVSRAAATTAATFQVASAVTLQYYLQNILERLDSLSAQVDRVYEFLTESAAAEITATVRACEELEQLFLATGSLEDRDVARLTTAEDAITAAFFRDLALTERLVADLQRIDEPLLEALNTIGTTRYPRHLRRIKAELTRLGDELPGSQQTLERLLLSAEVRARLMLLRAASESVHESDRSRVVLGHMRDELVEQGQTLGELAQDLRVFGGASEDAIARLFSMDGKVKAVLAEYERVGPPLSERVDRMASIFVGAGRERISAIEVRQNASGGLDILDVTAG